MYTTHFPISNICRVIYHTIHITRWNGKARRKRKTKKNKHSKKRKITKEVSKTVGWNPYLYSTPVVMQCTSCTTWRMKSKYSNVNSCSSRRGQCKWTACSTKRIKKIFQCLNLNLLSFEWIKLVSRLKPFLPFLSFIRHLCLMSHTHTHTLVSSWFNVYGCYFVSNYQMRRTLWYEEDISFCCCCCC